jgi:hypothetical protein
MKKNSLNENYGSSWKSWKQAKPVSSKKKRKKEKKNYGSSLFLQMNK